MKSILDPSFRYTPSAATDVRKTFARVRREQRKQAEQQAKAAATDPASILHPAFPRKAKP